MASVSIKVRRLQVVGSLSTASQMPFTVQPAYPFRANSFLTLLSARSQSVPSRRPRLKTRNLFRFRPASHSLRYSHNRDQQGTAVWSGRRRLIDDVRTFPILPATACCQVETALCRRSPSVHFLTAAKLLMSFTFRSALLSADRPGLRCPGLLPWSGAERKGKWGGEQPFPTARAGPLS